MDLYDIPVTTIDGQPTTLGTYRGKVLLVVNVASECGFTPQYTGLEELFKKYQDRGLVVLGFPCNQFGGQEPGTEAEIQQFCSLKLGVTFPMFAKLDVNGANAHPLYRCLKERQKGIFGTALIKWNFTKFLVDRAGNAVKRYGPRTAPPAIASDVEKLLDGQ